MANGDYSFVWMSDTQYYSESYPDTFTAMTQWIYDNIENLNIKYLFHTGDVVNNSSKKSQWKNADKAMSILDGALPYSILAGNNDVGSGDNDFTDYLNYFGADRFSNNAYTDKWYNGGQCSFDLVTIENTKYLFIALSWNSDDNALSWANNILNTYSDCIAIITTHDYLNASDKLSDNGKLIYNQLVVPNSNVHLVLCGHKSDAAKRISELDDNGDGETDRTVYQLMADYQNAADGGDGYLRILTIDKNAKEIKVQTYSPLLDKYNYFDTTKYPEKDEFTIPVTEWFE